MELGEFNIQYQLRIAIKGQAVANFIAEFTALSCEIGDTSPQASSNLEAASIIPTTLPLLKSIEAKAMEELTPMSRPWPFAQWVINIIGPLPHRKKKTKFVIVVVDYFTKWAEAKPVAKITEQKLMDSVWKNIICQFGIPCTIVSDNGKQFDNDKFRDMCRGLGISNAYSSPHHL
ncbi:uncharacterized protein LOC131249658 [Magnolia sinica]|uniref:uncharacterized protein LOC131249658 n=1 Tax=Magnolia sinica TaxID=86752 RepID=UPI00265A0566|nr:uncharacterized protein LOC131249658 [Magnolia sinica]